MADDYFYDEKSYEELFAEAISMIPLYTREWTNFNRSDPGITILENFAAFHVLQQESMKMMTEETERNLLKLVGIESGVNRGNRFFLAFDKERAENDVSGAAFPLHRKLYMGKTCVEPARPSYLKPESIMKVAVVCGQTRRDVTGLVAPTVPTAIFAFGNPQKAGAEICFLLETLPEPGETFSLYFEVEEDKKRTPFDDSHIPDFAKWNWQCFTENGWTGLSWRDETAYFLTCGRVIFTMPAARAARRQEGGQTGYTLRCRLVTDHYDRAPILKAVYGSFVEIEQKETVAASFFSDGGWIVIESGLADEACIEIYCREKAGEDYRRYTPGSGTGRFYEVTERREGYVKIQFDREKYGFGPCEGERSVLAVCYTREMARHRLIGTIYGYENQVMEMEQVSDVIPEGFTVLAEKEGEDGTSVYRVIKPFSQNKGEPGYELRMREGSLFIFRPELSGTCRLYLCDCAVTKGSRMQIRRGSRLASDKENFTVISSGQGGNFYETVEELKERFYQEYGRSGKRYDRNYEMLVKETPGLCIEQVKVWEEEGNRLEIAVKPSGRAQNPPLTPLYQREILRHLEESRQITMRIHVRGPEYVPIVLYGSISVKGQFGDCEDQIAQALFMAVERQAKEAGFGGVIYFDEIYRAVRTLECVDSILELTPRIRNGTGGSLAGRDILLDKWCLGYYEGEHVNLVRR